MICSFNIVSGIAIIATIVISIVLAYYTDLLKDKVNAEVKASYSLSRTQMFLWTLIIASCFVYKFFNVYHFDLLNSTCVVLLGIGTATALTSRVIDHNWEKKAQELKNNEKSEAMENDIKKSDSVGSMFGILSDHSQNTAVHRYQAVLFNLLFMLMFVVYFLRDCEFPVFDDTELALLAISSGGYVFFKSNENVPNTNNIEEKK